MNAISAGRRTISQTFSPLRAAGRIGLVPFVPAGYPDLQTTGALLPALESAGASAIEVGLPFTDPIADGPVIQEAYVDALARKVSVADVFATVASVREKVSVPLVAMVSYSIVYRMGAARFVKDAKAAGFDGLILPDLPPPEAQRVCDVVREGGLDTILLVAPTTTPARRAEIAGLSSGFVYYLSVSGITGERDQLPGDLADNVRSLKGLTETPVCVGFGISQARHVAQLIGLADGAIVGSGIVRRMKQHLNEGSAAIAQAIAAYARELLSLVPGGLENLPRRLTIPKP
ncbi:MAG TPA: tryptophan synthase subunit alpha [Tepidisphaeraceae bacterium]|nr:tryptophan synthase subunit alpha [Tepidisphaeraceae bacterium]